MSAYVTLEHVDKRFGSFYALRDVCFAAESGRVTGLVGRNGSGKTVLLKCVVGLMYADGGTVTVGGRVIGRDDDFARRTGFVIESPGFLGGQSAFHNLKYLTRISREADDEAIRAAIRRVGLDPDSRKAVGKYSMGMKQRLGIAQALMGEPELLVLDEPMNGLDEDGMRDMRALFSQLREQGKTIVMASHNRDDISALCDAVYEVVDGRLRPLTAAYGQSGGKS